MDIRVTSAGLLLFGTLAVRCALGRGGVTDGKTEGDGATPLGRWPLRRVLYRADRLAAPFTDLPIRALHENDGWCDAPTDAAYNLPVSHPYPASAEHLWRDDSRYDILVVLGVNDDPVIPQKGSAIFFHLAAPDYTPTEGCVAVAKKDMIDILKSCDPSTRMLIEKV